MHLTRIILEYVRRPIANNNRLKNRNKPKELFSKEKKKNRQTNDKQLCGTTGTITEDQSHNQMNSVHVEWPAAEETGTPATSTRKEENANE